MGRKEKDQQVSTPTAPVTSIGRLNGHGSCGVKDSVLSTAEYSCPVIACGINHKGMWNP